MKTKVVFLLLVYISSLLWETFFLLNWKELQFFESSLTSAEVSWRLILTCLTIHLSSLTIVLCFLPLLCLSLISDVSWYLLTVFLTVLTCIPKSLAMAFSGSWFFHLKIIFQHLSWLSLAAKPTCWKQYFQGCMVLELISKQFKHFLLAEVH